jgi:hypothetical protein
LVNKGILVKIGIFKGVFSLILTNNKQIMPAGGNIDFKVLKKFRKLNASDLLKAFDVTFKGDQFTIASLYSKSLDKCECGREDEHVALICLNSSCPNHENQPLYCSSCVEDRHVHELKYIHRFM